MRDDRQAWLRATLEERWGDEIAVGRGRVWTLHGLPALVAVDYSRERVGVATYIVQGAVAELVSIDALRMGAGVGRQLVDAVAARARAAGAERLLVMTTNDNLAALRFYQRRGFRLAELRRGAVDDARATLSRLYRRPGTTASRFATRSTSSSKSAVGRAARQEDVKIGASAARGSSRTRAS